MRSVRRAALLLAAISGLAGCSEPHHPGRPVVSAGRESFPLPSDGYSGGIALAAMVGGPFHAKRVGSGACASLGSLDEMYFLWPAGYRVAFTPSAELLDANGRVVAREGQSVTAGGGQGDLVSADGVCARKGERTWAVAGVVSPG